MSYFTHYTIGKDSHICVIDLIYIFIHESYSTANLIEYLVFLNICSDMFKVNYERTKPNPGLADPSWILLGLPGELRLDQPI